MRNGRGPRPTEARPWEDTGQGDMGAQQCGGPGTAPLGRGLLGRATGTDRHTSARWGRGGAACSRCWGGLWGPSGGPGLATVCPVLLSAASCSGAVCHHPGCNLAGKRGQQPASPSPGAFPLPRPPHLLVAPFCCWRPHACATVAPTGRLPPQAGAGGPGLGAGGAHTGTVGATARRGRDARAVAGRGLAWCPGCSPVAAEPVAARGGAQGRRRPAGARR